MRNPLLVRQYSREGKQLAPQAYSSLKQALLVLLPEIKTGTTVFKITITNRLSGSLGQRLVITTDTYQRAFPKWDHRLVADRIVRRLVEGLANKTLENTLLRGTQEEILVHLAPERSWWSRLRERLGLGAS